MPWRFRKVYSKIHRITVHICDIVKMAKIKDGEATVEKSAVAFSIGGDKCAKQTKEALCISGMS